MIYALGNNNPAITYSIGPLSVGAVCPSSRIKCRTKQGLILAKGKMPKLPVFVAYADRIWIHFHLKVKGTPATISIMVSMAQMLTSINKFSSGRGVGRSIGPLLFQLLLCQCANHKELQLPSLLCRRFPPAQALVWVPSMAENLGPKAKRIWDRKRNYWANGKSKEAIVHYQFHHVAFHSQNL